MGWGSGSSLLGRTWEVVRGHISKSERVAVLKDIIRLFENEDCDTAMEILCDEWPEAEQAYFELHPKED